MLGTSAPSARSLTPCGIGSGWFTSTLFCGATLRTTLSTAMKLVYCVSRLYFRPSSVMRSLKAALPSSASWSLRLWMRWRAHSVRSAAVSWRVCGVMRTSSRYGPVALWPSMITRPLASPRHLPNTITGRSPSTSGSACGSTSYTSRPPKVAFTFVSTGDSTMRRKRAACSGACTGSVMMKGSPMPARAMPSMRLRFTDEPMPKANTLAFDRLLRTSSKASRSTVT
ncbi:hypothetical protein D3C72_1597830 [compost metagenome]